jgi:malonyl-CoA O-methyltransferase
MFPILEPDRGYALWAETYPPRAHNELMRVEESAMMTLWKALRADRVLDVGTGTGRNLGLLRKAREKVGVDRSTAMLKRASAPARVVAGDAESLPFRPGSFDLVVSSLMAGDLRDLSRFTLEAARVLRPGGSLLYSDFHPTWAERSWQRTFESADGRKWQIPYHPHEVEDHLRALRTADLERVALEEPVLRGAPVLIVLRAVKR